MRWIRESCGAEIDRAVGGDRTRAALLAAIAANESGGRRQTYRFVPEIHHRLTALLHGADEDLDGLTKVQLEKYLSSAHTEAERSERLKRLAGLHGYTQIPGYFAVVWKVPLDLLSSKEKHFELAVKRLDEMCQEHELNPATHAAEIGRRWQAGASNGSRTAILGWRLQERARLYLETAPPPPPATAVPVS